MPHVWLAPKQTVAIDCYIDNAPTAFGRLPLSMHTAANGKTMGINVTLPSSWSWPTGQVSSSFEFAYRTHQQSTIRSVSIGGKAIAFDRAQETVTLLKGVVPPIADELTHFGHSRNGLATRPSREEVEQKQVNPRSV